MRLEHLTALKNGIPDALQAALGDMRDFTQYMALEFAHVLGIRHRHVFTRGNRIRLRYVTGTLVVVMLSFGALLIDPQMPEAKAVYVADMSAPVQRLPEKKPQMVARTEPEPVTVKETVKASKDISDLLDGSLYAKLSLATARLPKIPQPQTKTVKVKSGDALGLVLQRAGIANAEAAQAIKALSKHFNPKHLKPGQAVDVRFEPTSENVYLFTDLKLIVDPIKSVIVEREEDVFSARVEEKEVFRKLYAQKADIDISVYGSAQEAGIPKASISELIRIYSWDVDFQRDVRSGDSVEIMYDNYETEDGYVAKNGDIVYAKLIVGGVEKPVYRFEMEDGRVDYFGPDGKSVRKALMKTPVDGARISSGYGMRRHPVLGYSKMHKGMDFAAPTGTPIYAAGDGIVEYAGRNGSYGKYIRIRHNGSLKTAYAHMKSIHKKVGSGKRVIQGQVIGYIGSTGRSTGPHLHYEVHVNGRQINPRSLKLPTGETLEGKQLVAFKKAIKQMDREYAALTDGVKYARRNSAKRFN